MLNSPFFQIILMRKFRSIIFLSLSLALFFNTRNTYAEDNSLLISGFLNSAENFFMSLKSGDYRTSWRLLSQRSRETIVNDVYKTSKKMGVNIASQEIKSDFEKSGMISNSYWKAAFHDTFDPDIIIKESKWEMGVINKNRAEIIITHIKACHPAPAHLKVLKEYDEWRVGLVETFWTRKL